MSKCESEKCANGCRSGRCGDDGAGGGSEVCPPPGWEPYAALDAARDSMAALDAARDSMAALDAARRSVSGIDVLRRLAREADVEDRDATPDFPAGGPVYPEAGLAFSRTFSGGPPPKLVERTAEIKDARGNIVFRQEGVLFPEEYSQTAVNVVASKYFYGDVDNGSGDPREGKREYSMAQLVDRVVGPIARWGREDGYFKSAEDADAFADDLRAILIGQYAAFNSPVWFNLGLHDSYGVESDTVAWRWDAEAGRIVALEPGEGYEFPTCSACLPYAVRVNTDRGLIPIGDIERGMRSGLQYSTFDADGRPSRIVKAVCNGVRYVMRYRLADGTSLEMTSDHRVFVRTAAGVEEKQAKDLRIGEDELVLGRYTLLARDRDVILGPIRVTEDVAWLAGVMVGNGFSGRPETATSETWEIKVNTQAEMDRAVAVCDAYAVPYATKRFHWGWTVRGYGEAAKSFWVALDLWGRTHDKRIPEWVMTSPFRLATAFIRGLFDTDGCALGRPNNRGSIGFSNVSSDVAGKLQILLRSIGIYSSLSGYQDPREDYTRQYCWTVLIQDIVSVSRFRELVGFTNTNKATALANWDGSPEAAYRAESLKVVGSERAGTTAVYDIQTESSVFWAEGVLVHNCFIQGVDDTLDSIMDLAKAEAMLFKGGSGTGADLSTLRSTREKLTGGGRPSGPVSFFRVYDAVASAIKSGGKTRRAARMQTLLCDHPDVVEFAECKVKEDRKARALVAAGWSSGMTGADDEAYSSVAFQNTNISLRATDEFMRKASGDDPDPYYWTKAVVDGRPVEKLDAREVLDLIARGTWECGDPGMQYHDTVNRWNTAADTCELKSTNPCGEYNYVNDSSCNLASLRLTRFLCDDGTFDVGRFEAAVRVVLTAQEIIVDHASYPTRKIARNSHDHRPLGLGYADLGALLMSLGLPYDSAAGRSYAGAIAAVMQGAAARTSAEMARVCGPYPAFAANRGSMLRVMRMHAEGARNGLTAATELGSPALPIWERAADLWSEESLAFGAVHGYMNAQLSVQAPTGTISFMMGCRTTGIEPELGLVKYKSLSGGGLMKLVNDGVGPALSRLGYSDREVAAIVAHIEATDSIEGAPHLKTAHLPVFDCAFAAGDGGRTISWQGHVEMMAAIQPFISGAQSKTINIPSSFDVNAIRRIYIEAWRLGLKAVAIYRDGSKGVQPLTTKKAEEKPEGVVTALAATPAGTATVQLPRAAVEEEKPVADLAASTVARGAKASADPREPAIAVTKQANGRVTSVALPLGPVAAEKSVVDLAAEIRKVVNGSIIPTARSAPRRERLPDTRRAVNHKFNVGGHEGYLNVGLFADGRPGELFITMAKEGSTVGGLMDVVGTLTSMCLQYGVPLEVLVEKLSHVRFEPQGFTKNPDVPIAKSLVDYIFRWMGAEFIPGWREEHCPSREDDAGKSVATGVADRPAVSPRKAPQGDAPACSECGAITVRAGSCYTCVQCGSSSGCG